MISFVVYKRTLRICDFIKTSPYLRFFTCTEKNRYSTRSTHFQNLWQTSGGHIAWVAKSVAYWKAFKRSHQKCSKEMEDSNDLIVIIDDDPSNSNSESNSTASGTGLLNKDKDEAQNDDQDGVDLKTDDVATQELKKLSLDQNGTFMVDFDPEKSKRELRKMNRRIHPKGSKKNQLYDEHGILLENSMDLCDCLDKNCPGCHFPCVKCGSGKCATDCRCNRKYVIDLIEVEGKNILFSFPT